ncbi:phage tail protein [Cohnella thailandensis]
MLVHHKAVSLSILKGDYTMSDPYVGEIRMFSGNYAPPGWAVCMGQELLVYEYRELFERIGTLYGGDGKRTFALPDLRGRLPIHYGMSSSGTPYALGQKGGSEQVKLMTSQLPVHTHTVRANSAQGMTDGSADRFLAAGTVNGFSVEAPNACLNASAISSAGGNQPHDNVMPFFPLTFIIALRGERPLPGEWHR